MLRRGDALGEWTLEAPLAVGGMAEVWSAAGGGGARAALKVLFPEASAEAARDELLVAERLDHPNVARARQAFEHGGRVVLVLELIDGKDLRRLLSAEIARGGRVPAEVAAGIGRAAASGLAYAHAEGVVHRDVSPHNVMVAGGGAVKLLDFGIALFRERAARTRPGVLKGKLGYLAPEVARGERATAAADVFGLGVVLWESLALTRLFDAPSDAEVLAMCAAGKVPPLGVEVPGALERLIAGMLALRADDRPAMPEVEAALAPMSAGPEAVARWAAPLVARKKKTAALPRAPW